MSLANLSTAEILEAYCPTFHYHEDEPYLPVDWRKSFRDSKQVAAKEEISAHVEYPIYTVRSAPDVIRGVPVMGRVYRKPVSDGHVYVDYWLFYEFNGNQGFALTPGVWAKKNKTFNWGPLGNHAGDFENVTLMINKATGNIRALYLSAHGAAEAIEAPAEIAGAGATHIDVYCGLNSHANYLEADGGFARSSNSVFDTYMPFIIPVITLGSYGGLQIGDLLSTVGPTFAPHAADNEIVDLSSGSSDDWYAYTGNWGAVINQQLGFNTPDVGFFGIFMFFILIIAFWVGLLASFVTDAEQAPPPPFTRSEYNDPSVYFSRISLA
jgi:hypothetical protein